MTPPDHRMPASWRPGLSERLPARGPFALLRRLPVRVRLALISAGLTFVILLLFALVIGVFTAREVHTSFDNEIRLTADSLASDLRQSGGNIPLSKPIQEGLTTGDVAVRLLSSDGTPVQATIPSPNLGPPSTGLSDVNGYRVATRPLGDQDHPLGYLQYAKRLSTVQHTIVHVRLFLILGVLAGTALALLAGLALARRAMRPIANLTRAAKDIAQTRDTGVQIPKPEANDEVADLADTLEEMLIALDSARSDTQAALDRQREFVADASHELRTPLTSILANLELLESELNGEEADIARAALRSSRRMRRLVADLLLLARADAGRPVRREDVNFTAVVREAAAEAAPMAADHELTVDISDGGPLIVNGSGDELHRLVLNLVQNALAHTPEGSRVDVSATREGTNILLRVADNGPGIPDELRPRIFERFVRGNGDRSRGGSGLGLAIVSAVAESHGGTVSLSDCDGGGACFEVAIPAAAPTVTEERFEATPSPSLAARSGKS